MKFQIHKNTTTTGPLEIISESIKVFESDDEEEAQAEIERITNTIRGQEFLYINEIIQGAFVAITPDFYTRRFYRLKIKT